MPKYKTGLACLAASYRLCARAEGKSQKTIDMVTSSLGYLENFLNSRGMVNDVTGIGPNEIRAFILYLQQKRRFSNHPLARPLPGILSAHTVSCYLRSIRVIT